MNNGTLIAEKINCLDLSRQHKQIRKEVLAAFEKVYDQNAFSDGIFVQQFEKEFSSFCHTRFAVGLDNGTSALHLALLTLGIGEGDEVIVPANTFIATAWAVSYCGATPVFADCTDDTWQIDPISICERISPRTKAIIGVHLYGQPFDIDALKSIRNAHKLYLLEDAAQAHGAAYKGITVGGSSEMACFSFYPGKNLGACGEAGAITTNNEYYYNRLKSLRNHGSVVRYHHDELGFNMRMSGLEAASLSVKLRYLEKWNQRRKAIASRYQTEILNGKIRMQFQPEWSDSVYHLFVITTEERNELVRYLNNHNIYPGFHYPVPCHLQKAYSWLGYKPGDCPNSEYLAEHCLSLPMYAELTDTQVSYIIDTINNY